jgi:predicted nucleic acid-binding protein
LAAEAEARRQSAESEARRLAAEAEARRLAAEAEARQKAAEDAVIAASAKKASCQEALKARLEFCNEFESSDSRRRCRDQTTVQTVVKRPKFPIQ